MHKNRSIQCILNFLVIVGICTLYIVGCGEETENPIGADGAAGTVGTLKVPDTAPGAPNLVIPEGTPTVQSVGYYHDWRLTKPLTGTVPAGKTIFIKVEFSEDMKLVVADDKHARPILYYRIGGELTRFNIANFGAKGEDFVSGDAKPMQTKASFICKYQVQPEDIGEFVFAVGKWSIDLEGNTLPAFYTHKEKLQLGKSAPTVTSVDYYRNWQLTEHVTDTIKPGTTVYTKIVFSEEMEHVVSDGAKARPELYYRIGDRDIRHNIVPYKANGRHFTHGDTKPLNKQGVYVGKYTVKSTDFGSFTLVVGTDSVSKKGVKIPEEYVHAEALHIPDPPPPTVTLTGVPTGIDNTDMVSVAVRGSGVTHYQYSVAAGEACGDYGNPAPIHRRLTVNVSDLPDGTVTLCVLGKNLAGIWQTKPTTAQWTRDTSVVPALPDPVVTDNTEAVPVTLPGAQDFSGFVYTPKPVSTGFFTRSSVLPVSGATITALSGSVSGQTVTTSQNGHYVFRNVAETSLLLRVEKNGFEPKEVEAHRFRPTTLSSGVRANFTGDPQNTPGNILIGHRWTSDIRPVLNKITVVHDLLYVDGRGAPNIPRWLGEYGHGVVFVYRAENNLGLQAALIHEVIHAHQHALVSVDGSGGDTSSWKNTPEGIAFAAARERDWQQVGKLALDTRPHTIVLHENAAAFYTVYWFNLVDRNRAPNRFAWADTWLPK